MKMTHATDLGFLVMILCGMGMSQAVRHVAVMEGERLFLSCRKSPGHMDWKNERDEVLFFNDIKVSMDSRYSILSFTSSDYTLAVSSVTFKDEGMYACYHYSNNLPKVTVRRYNVTVIGAPKITFTKHGDRTLVKCSAKGNTPPVVSWQIGSGIDLEARPQHTKQDKTGKWTTEDIISIKVLTRKETLKCVLQDPTSHGSLGVRFVVIENEEYDQYSTQTSSTAQTSTSPTSQTTDSPHVSTHFTITGGTEHMDTTSMETSQYTNTNINTTSTEGSSSMPVNTSSTSVTENYTRNFTEEVDKPEIGQRQREGGSASLFITAVTALIICLLVVVTFFVVKLRRAHKKWKLEKEESDQSVESGKSKSSGEEGRPKVSLGFLKSNFRKHKAGAGALGQQTSASTSASTLASNPASAAASHSATHTVEVIVENHANNGIKQTQNHGAAPVKETEL